MTDDLDITSSTEPVTAKLGKAPISWGSDPITSFLFPFFSLYFLLGTSLISSYQNTIMMFPFPLGTSSNFLLSYYVVVHFNTWLVVRFGSICCNNPFVVRFSVVIVDTCCRSCLLGASHFALYFASIIMHLVSFYLPDCKASSFTCVIILWGWTLLLSGYAGWAQRETHNMLISMLASSKSKSLILLQPRYLLE
jgi:hypothetical protein